MFGRIPVTPNRGLTRQIKLTPEERVAVQAGSLEMLEARARALTAHVSAELSVLSLGYAKLASADVPSSSGRTRLEQLRKLYAKLAKPYSDPEA